MAHSLWPIINLQLIFVGKELGSAWQGKKTIFTDSEEHNGENGCAATQPSGKICLEEEEPVPTAVKAALEVPIVKWKALCKQILDKVILRDSYFPLHRFIELHLHSGQIEVDRPLASCETWESFCCLVYMCRALISRASFEFQEPGRQMRLRKLAKHVAAQLQKPAEIEMVQKTLVAKVVCATSEPYSCSYFIAIPS